MALTFKNSPNTTAQLPLVNINGEDFLVSDVIAIARETGGVRVTASFEEDLKAYVPPAKPDASKPVTALPASVPENDKAGLITPP